MNIPENLFYTNDHEWIRIEGNNAWIGITDFAQRELGDIVYVEIETIGDKLKSGEVFGTVEAVKTVSDLFIPINGIVLEQNPLLEQKPELVNADPYGDAWMIKVEIEGELDTANLLDAAAYNDLIGV